MYSYEELEGRVTAAEHGLERVRVDAAAARALASGADRDVSLFGAKLDAHTKVLNALRETQLEQGSRLDRVEGRLDRVEGRLDRVEGRLDRVEGTLDRLERKVDDGFARIDQEFVLINQGFVKVEDQFAKLGAGMAHLTTLMERLIEPEQSRP